MATASPAPRGPLDPDVLEPLISPERFATYTRATRGDRQRAAALYAWNAQVAAAFSEVTGHVEVIVRNAMHAHLQAHHATIAGRPAGAAWFDGPSWPRHHWFALPAQRSVDDAIRRARHSPQQPRPGKVIAELGFGFWRYLANDRYEQSFWEPALDGAFAAPGATPRQRRRAVEDHLAPLHLLRNRIAHHEPVSGTITYKPKRRAPVTHTLTDLHAIALEVTGWISTDAADWLATFELDGLLQQRP